MSAPAEPTPDDVAEADWAEQHVAADPEADALVDPEPATRPVTIEADPADLAEQDVLAYVEDDEV